MSATHPNAQTNQKKPQPQILIIDDEELLSSAITRTLRDDYRVTTANSGVEGLKKARQIKPDLIVLDVLMPGGMDGFATGRELKSDPHLKSTPILYLSGLSDIEAKITGFEVGADDFLSKPFDVRELRLRIKAILRRHPPRQKESADALSKQSGLTLNHETFQVTTPTGARRLTPIEFDLLHYFMTHPKQIFASERLLQDIWDYPPGTGSPDLVRMHIKNLRKKIEPDPKNPVYLKTIPRRGYVLLLNPEQ